MMMRAVAVIAIAVSTLCASSMSALSGHVSVGTVPVAGAIVTISTPSGFAESVTSDGAGQFAFHSVLPGHYNLRVTAKRYAVFEEPVLVSSNSVRNHVEIKTLVPADQQTVSILNLLKR
jgi:Carboxypeptidase regulatory-like domain